MHSSCPTEDSAASGRRIENLLPTVRASGSGRSPPTDHPPYWMKGCIDRLLHSQAHKAPVQLRHHHPYSPSPQLPSDRALQPVGKAHQLAVILIGRDKLLAGIG